MSDIGGLGAVSVGVSGTTLLLIGIVVILLMVGAAWKIAKLLWAAFSG
jgi:hypothetical protein